MKISKRLRGEIESKAHKVNLDRLKLLLSEKWCQKLVAKARRTGKIPPNGYKSSASLIKKVGKKSYVFTWQLELNKNLQRRAKFHGYIREIEQRANLPENFRDYLLVYILYGKISAPLLNFVVRKEYKNLRYSDKPLPYPSLVQFGPLHKAERELARQMEKELIKDYPSHLQRRSRPYRKIDRDLRIEELSNRKGRKMGQDADERDVKYSDYNIADELWGSEDISKDTQRRNIIRTSRTRLKKRKKTRGVT